MTHASDGGYKEYLFTYRFDGKEWGLGIPATSEAEAKERLKAIPLARYEGVLMARIPAASGAAGPLVRFTVWLLNVMRVR